MGYRGILGCEGNECQPAMVGRRRFMRLSNGEFSTVRAGEEGPRRTLWVVKRGNNKTKTLIDASTPQWTKRLGYSSVGKILGSQEMNPFFRKIITGVSYMHMHSALRMLLLDNGSSVPLISWHSRSTAAWISSRHDRPVDDGRASDRQHRRYSLGQSSRPFLRRHLIRSR